MTVTRISDKAAIILRAMYRRADAYHDAVELVDETGVHQATVRQVLARLTDAGWLVSQLGARVGKVAARRRYRFTRAGKALAAAELDGWEFDDARS